MVKLAHAQAIARELVSDPLEVVLTSWSKLQERQEHRKPRFHYVADSDWERRLHLALGAAFPCSIARELDPLWADVLSALTRRGINPGPASYSGWNDGDPGLVRAIWCLVRHLRATRVVETGVAHGVTSRFILEALKRNGDGRLWSIDLPVQLRRYLHHQIGVCVGDGFADSWSYVKGSSRRRLPALLRRVGPIDLFVHDSRHTEYNVLFELREAWQFLRPGGAIVVDDIDVNWGFHIFTEELPRHLAVIADAEPIRPDVVRFNQKGLFGIILKDIR
jgi:hypothetical protein